MTLDPVSPALAPARAPRGPRRRSKPAGALRNLAEAALAVAGLALFRILPEGAAVRLARVLGALAWAFARRLRRRVLRHMDLAFGEAASPAQKRRWRRNHFDHLALTLCEFARFAHLTPGNVARTVDFSELRVLDELLARGRGVLAVPPHFGNWELCGYAGALHGYQLNPVTRPPKNPYLTRLLYGMRERAGIRPLLRWDVITECRRVLRSGAVVSMPIDQNVRHGGVFVPFFGRLASTTPAPAILHLSTGAPILVASVNRERNGRHRYRVWDVVEQPRSGDLRADRFAVLQRINAAYERAIRAYPEQWLWAQNRWKTRPEGEAPGRAASPTSPDAAQRAAAPGLHEAQRR